MSNIIHAEQKRTYDDIKKQILNFYSDENKIQDSKKNRVELGIDNIIKVFGIKYLCV